jgi:6-phosphogluconolactonase (cycloisomerase 2 family)
MRALAITASFFIITVLSGCLGSNNSSSAPTLAFLYIVGNGDNSIRGLAEKTTGDLQSLPVSVFTTSPRPVSLALHPSKNFLYVPNLTSNTVSGFNVDHINGVLTPIGTAVPPTPTQLQPVAAGVNSGGGFLYVLNQGSASISVFSIDPARGLLSEIAGSPFATAANPQSMVLSPNTGLLYVGNGTLGTISGFAIAANGTLSAVAGSPFSAGAGATVAGITIDSKGQFLYAADSANNKIASFSVAGGGTLTPVAGSPFAAGTKPVSIAVDTNAAFLYAANQGSNNVSAFKISSGALSEITGSPYAVITNGSVGTPTPSFLTVDVSNTFLYVANTGSSSISAFTIKASDGTLTLLTTSPFLQGIAPTWMLSTQ